MRRLPGFASQAGNIAHGKDSRARIRDPQDPWVGQVPAGARKEANLPPHAHWQAAPFDARSRQFRRDYVLNSLVAVGAVATFGDRMHAPPRSTRARRDRRYAQALWHAGIGAAGGQPGRDPERLVAVRDGLHDRSVGGLLTAGSFADPFAFDRESVPIRPGLILCAQGVIDGLPEAGVDLRQFAATDRAQIDLRGKGRRTGPVSAGVHSTGPIARDPAPGTVNRKPIDAFGPGGQVGQMTSHP